MIPTLDEYIKEELSRMSKLKDEFSNELFKDFLDKEIKESKELLKPYTQRIRDMKIDDLLRD